MENIWYIFPSSSDRTALIFLVVLTMLVLAIVRSVTLEERMAAGRSGQRAGR